MPRRDQESLSTSDSVANLARAPDFQHCPAIDNSTHYQTQVMEIPDRLKELTITRSWRPLSHKARCIAMERSGSPQHQTILPTWHRCQISNTVWEIYCEYLAGLKRLSIKSRRLPSREAGCNAAERSGSPSTPDNVANLARARFSTLSRIATWSA